MNEKLKTFFRRVGTGLFTAMCILGGIVFSYLRKRAESDTDGCSEIERRRDEYAGKVESSRAEYQRTMASAREDFDGIVQSATEGLSDAEQIISKIKARKPISS